MVARTATSAGTALQGVQHGHRAPATQRGSSLGWYHEVGLTHADAHRARCAQAAARRWRSWCPAWSCCTARASSRATAPVRSSSAPRASWPCRSTPSLATSWRSTPRRTVRPPQKPYALKPDCRPMPARTAALACAAIRRLPSGGREASGCPSVTGMHPAQPPSAQSPRHQVPLRSSGC